MKILQRNFPRMKTLPLRSGVISESLLCLPQQREQLWSWLRPYVTFQKRVRKIYPRLGPSSQPPPVPVTFRCQASCWCLTVRGEGKEFSGAVNRIRPVDVTVKPTADRKHQKPALAISTRPSPPGARAGFRKDAKR